MNIIFLDIDGVMSSHNFYIKLSDRLLKSSLLSDNMCMYNVWNLKYIMDNVKDLSLVISSTWRKSIYLEEIRETFQDCGIEGKRIIDITPNGKNRAEEIKSWIKGNKFKGKWLALDDQHIPFSPRDAKNLYIVNNLNGLLYSDALVIIDKFKRGFRPPVILI